MPASSLAAAAASLQGTANSRRKQILASVQLLLLDPLNRAVQGYRQHFAHKAGLIVCQGQLFSLLRRNSLLCPCQNRAPFVTKKHSISMSDVPRIRKKSLKVSHHSATPEAFWIKHAFATSSVCKAKKKKKEPSASFWLFRVFCF